MTNSISERARKIVAETLPLMEQNRGLLEEALERNMARHGPRDPSAGTTTAAILDLLLGHPGRLAGDRSTPAVLGTGRRHRALPLGIEHYSCFGDGLKPVMKDVLGSEASSPVLAAWTDAYWATVRTLFRQETQLAG